MSEWWNFTQRYIMEESLQIPKNSIINAKEFSNQPFTFWSISWWLYTYLSHQKDSTRLQFLSTLIVHGSHEEDVSSVLCSLYTYNTNISNYPIFYKQFKHWHCTALDSSSYRTTYHSHYHQVRDQQGLAVDILFI